MAWILSPFSLVLLLIYSQNNITQLSSNPGLTSPSLSESTASHSTIDDSSMAPFSFRFPGRFAAPLLDPKLDNIHEQPITESDERAPEAISVDHSTFLRVSHSTEDGHSVTSSTKERRNKLKKKSGYESDGGYVSEGGKKPKKGTKEKKDKGAGADYESDGGYLSEAVSSKKSTKKSKSKKVPKDSDQMSPISDPEALLAAVNATLRVPISLPDGYITDSATSKRGRTKTKKEKSKGTRPTSPVPPVPGTEGFASALAPPDTPSKKNRLLRMMTRSASRDREKDKVKQADEVAPPPVPPLPMSLPIAEKFARAGPFAHSNTLSASSGASAGTSSAMPDMSRTSSAGDIWSSNATTGGLVPSPYLPLATRTLSSELWNNDILIPGGTKRGSLPEEAVITRSSAEDDRQVNTKALVPEQDIPYERTRSPVPFRSLSPVLSAPINALLSTPEKRRKKKQITSSPGGSVSSAETNSNSNGSSRPQLKVSTSAISQPNPHLAQRLRPPLSPLEIAATMKIRSEFSLQSTNLGLPPPSPAKLSPGYVQMGMPSPSVSANRTPDSYVFVEKEGENGLPSGRTAKERQSTFSVIPSSDYLVPSPLPSPGPSGLAGRRAKNITPLASTQPLNVTPKGSRSNTPVPGSPNMERHGGFSIPNTPTARASVIAYYQIPPPSPPPSGPLPRVPDVEQTPRRGSDDRQFLSPGAARYGSRSPSPLRNAPSRPTSPSGLFGQAIPPVRRGRESPFPTRPILPAEDRGALVRRPSTAPKTIRPDAPLGVTRAVSPDSLEARMQRYKNNYASLYQDDDAEVEEQQNDVYSSSEDFHEDTRNSAYIRQARARGEKRVYFSDQTTSASEEDFDVRMAVNALRQSNPDIEVDDDDHSRYTLDVRDDDDGSYDRRSMASMSVYSRYSMLDADRSAELREGFVKRVEALYGKGGWDDIPAVPEIPASLRVPGPKMFTRNASSPSRF